MAVREGKWKCPSCATVNRGPVQNCTGCGYTRDANVKFFLDDAAPEVSDPALLAAAKAGADWVCGFCNNTNPRLAQQCSSCGAPASEGKIKAHGNVIPTSGGATAGGPPPLPGTAIPVAAAAAQPSPPPLPNGALPGGPKPAGKTPLACLVVIPVLLLLCCVGSYFMGRAHEDTATVTSLAWERTIAVEAIKPVHETAWDSAPPGAREVTHAREVRDYKKVQRGTRTVMKDTRVQVGTKKVVVGHKDLGNGLFEDVTKDEPVYETRKVPTEEPVYVQEPIYGEKYSYVVDRWVPERTERASGSTEEPRWPETKIVDAQKQREGARTEKYQVIFLAKAKGSPTTLKVANAARFAQFKLNSEWKVQWSLAGTFDVLGPSGEKVPELELEASK